MEEEKIDIEREYSELVKEIHSLPFPETYSGAFNEISYLDLEKDRLLEERAAKEAEFKAYLQKNDAELNKSSRLSAYIAQKLIDTDVKKTGHISKEVEECCDMLRLTVINNRIMTAKGDVHTEMYKGFVSDGINDINTKTVYGNSIDEVLDMAGKLTNKANYKTVNIGTLDPFSGGYGHFYKFDIAKRYDITDVPLSLPAFTSVYETKALTQDFEAEGAKFNPSLNRWYAPYDVADKACFKPYIHEPSRQRDYSRQRLYTSQELALPVGTTGKTVNDMLSRYDGYVRITYEDNGNGFIAPKADFCKNEIPEDTEHTGEWLSDASVRTVLIRGKEMNKDIIYSGEGYQIKPETELVPHAPYVAIAEATEATGKYYCIYGIHDSSGFIFRLSPRRFDTKEQAVNNIPPKHEIVDLEVLQEEHKLYDTAWSKMIRWNAKNCGYDLSDNAIKNIKLLNYDTNRQWSLKQISRVYTQIINKEKLPDNLSERACAYIKTIGDECASIQRMERLSQEAAQP